MQRHCLIDVGGPSMLHLMEVPGVEISTGPMFARGRLDHLAPSIPDQASLYEMRDRLIDAGVSGGAVTDFGVALSVHFSDADGADAEITWFKDTCNQAIEQVRRG